MPFKKHHYLYCTFFTASFFSSGLKAQVIESSINRYGTEFPQEKIHIHFDKESYLPGETIWFKAYVFEENLPSERSTNFYAAIYDDKGKLIQQQVSPIIASTTDGHFTIPDSIKADQLVCRAFTGWMMNFDTSFLFTKTIKLFSNKPAENTPAAKTVSLQFFPEGGDVIEGVKNTIAFKSNFNNGLPFNADGVIKKKETGEVVMPLKTEHDGMGRFDIEVQPGDRFYAEWIDNNGTKQQTWLPEARARGLSLKLTVQKDKLYYNLVNKTGQDSLHVLAYLYQKVFYKADLAAAPAEPYTAMVPLNKLPSGTMQLTVFDANWQPVAERVAFINNDNFNIDAAIISKETGLSKRARNQLEILVPDTIKTNMSLSISDADMNNEPIENTIISDLLIRGDLKGYVHDPAYYFTNNNDATLRAHLDLVMLTNGWRRYSWAEMMTQQMPAVPAPENDYLSVYGQIGKEAMEKMEKDETVNLIVKTVDSTNNFYPVKPDNNGLLKRSGLVFYDSARVYFSFNKSKLLNRQMAFSSYNFTMHQPLSIDNYGNWLLQEGRSDTGSNPNTALFRYYSANNGIAVFNKEKTLENVQVKTDGRRSWRNDPLQKMEEKYTSGLFRGGSNAESFDLVHDETAESENDIYNYLGYRSRILQVKYMNGGKTIVGPVMGGRDMIPPLIYINERLADISELDMIWVSDIAFVKVIYPYFGTRDNGQIKTAVSIYMKKGDDLIDRRPKDTDLGMVKVAGYPPIKEFYSPDYSQNNTGTGTDARTTLLWVPYILTDANNRTVPISFYNNDLSKRFRVVLEGINDEGKMIHIEKIIE